MKLIDQITQQWAAGKAYRLSMIAEDPYGEYSRLDRLDGIDKRRLP